MMKSYGSARWAGYDSILKNRAKTIIREENQPNDSKLRRTRLASNLSLGGYEMEQKYVGPSDGLVMPF